MDANEYQRLAKRTIPDRFEYERSTTDDALLMSAMGLCGETGEVAEIVKKAIFHGHPLDRDQLANEAGDVALYLAALCTAAGLSLSDVMQANVDKLRRRFPDGFSTEASIARVDVNGADA